VTRAGLNTAGLVGHQMANTRRLSRPPRSVGNGLLRCRLPMEKTRWKWVKRVPNALRSLERPTASIRLPHRGTFCYNARHLTVLGRGKQGTPRLFFQPLTDGRDCLGVSSSLFYFVHLRMCVCVQCGHVLCENKKRCAQVGFYRTLVRLAGQQHRGSSAVGVTREKPRKTQRAAHIRPLQRLRVSSYC